MASSTPSDNDVLAHVQEHGIAVHNIWYSLTGIDGVDVDGRPRQTGALALTFAGTQTGTFGAAMVSVLIADDDVPLMLESIIQVMTERAIAEGDAAAANVQALYNRLYPKGRGE